MNQQTNRNIQDKAIVGVSLMILGLALYTISDAFIKHLVTSYHLSQVTFMRAFTRAVPLLFVVLMQGGFAQVFKTSRYSLHIIRLMVNLAYTSLFMYAFKCGTLTTVYTLSYTSPFFMILLGALFLREKVSIGKWLAVAVGLMGVMIAINPKSTVLEFAALIVLVATFLGALNKILMRKLAETEHSLAIAMYPNIMMILATLPFLVFYWKSMPIDHWLLFAFVGVLTATAQYSIAQALRFAQGSTLAPIDYSTFLWVVALDFVCWDQLPDQRTLLGAAIIVGSNFYILYRSRKEHALQKSIA